MNTQFVFTTDDSFHAALFHHSIVTIPQSNSIFSKNKPACEWWPVTLLALSMPLQSATKKEKKFINLFFVHS